MISFRNHVVSLIAVFLALAIGIVLGGGPMSASGRDADRSASSTVDPDALDAARSQAAYGDRLSSTLAGPTYRNRLDGGSVVLLTMPGADPSVADQLTEEIKRAGGSVTGRVGLTDTLTAPGQKALVDSLGSQLAAQNKGVVVDNASTYDRIGQLLARSVASRGAKSQPRKGKDATIGESLRAADLVTLPSGLKRRASYVVLVLGEDTDEESDPAYEELVQGLAKNARGVVLAGTAADGRSGRLARLREDATLTSVASVDGVDSVTGAVTTVLALITWPRAAGGAYGASGEDGAAPIG